MESGRRSIVEKSKAREGSGRGSLKKRHLGLAGMITVLLQYGVGVKNESSTAESIQKVLAAQLQAQKSELVAQTQTLRAERERDFVRKKDLDKTLRQLDRKLDQVDVKLGELVPKVSKIEGYLKARRPSWSYLEPSEELAPAREVSSR
jgi:hypothetical protein